MTASSSLMQLHIKRSGFTLIEILVVATIISVLAAVGIVSYSSTTKKSRDVKRVSDVQQLRNALEMYRSDNGSYPVINVGSAGNVSALDNTLRVGGYIPAIPQDPKGATQPYFYRATSCVGGAAPCGGYCVSALFESVSLPSPAVTCTAYTDYPSTYNYAQKSP